MFTENFSKYLIYIGVSLLLAMLLIFLLRTNIDFQLPIDPGTFGHFGDLVGGVIGAIWALAGVLLFYVALKDQKLAFEDQKKAIDAQIRSLEIQTDEFILQKKELQETRIVLKEQTKTFKQQQFENTFFQLLVLFRNTVANITLDIISKRDGLENRRTLRGIDCFREYMNVLREFYQREAHKESEDSRALQNAVNYLFESNKADLGDYMNLLLNVLEFVNTNSESGSLYINFCRRQLSVYELSIINYYLYSSNCIEELRVLISNLNILKNIDKSILFQTDHLYNKTDS